MVLFTRLSERNQAASEHDKSPLASPCAAAQTGCFPIHPYLFAAAPVVALYAGNIRQTPLRDVLLPLVVVVFTAAVLVLTMRLIFSRERAALASAVLLVPFLLSGALFDCAQKLYIAIGGNWLRYRYYFAAYCLLTVGCFIWVSCTKVDMRKLTRALNLFSAMFLLMPVLSIALAMVMGPSTTVPRVLETNSPEAEIALETSETPRDIYFLVFDRYADSKTLQADFGHDNSAFNDQLRDRGFHVVTDGRTNYPSTGLSMASCLNMAYHGEWIGGTDDVALIARHRVGTLLKRQGYKYYHLGTILGALRSNKLADVNFRFSALPSEFAEILYHTTPLAVVPIRSTPDVVRRQCDVVEEAAADEALTFVYSHFLLPHPPFMFNKDGSEVSNLQRISRSERENYVNQLMFTNDRIIGMVDQILATSEVLPIIVLQADEGPWLSAEGDAEKSDLEKIRKRTGILMALYLPDRDAEKIVPPRFSPVNTFRLVFREYFGAEIDLLDDRTFYWEYPTAWGAPDYSRPNRFIDVTERLRAVERREDGA